MNKNKSLLLTDFEFMFTIVGCIMAISIMSIPNTAVSAAKQDGWIATIMGAIYPLYIVLVGSIIIKKNPNTSIMDISKKYLGKIFGNLLNFLFMAQFLYYAIVVISADISMLITYSVWFMTPLKVAVLLGILVVYGTYKGLKVLARINVVAFFGFCLMMLPTFVAFKYGSILNLQPVFETDLSKLVKASIKTAFVYANMELILVIHPYVKNKKKITKLALISTVIVAILYTWSVFTATFYLGPDIVPKTLLPFYFVCESVRIPVINNFRFFIIVIWPLFLYRTVATEYYMSASIMDNITGINYKKWCIFLSPLIILIPLLFKNDVMRSQFSDLVTPYVTIFNLAYVTLIAILAVIKSKKDFGKPILVEEL